MKNSLEHILLNKEVQVNSLSKDNNLKTWLPEDKRDIYCNGQGHVYQLLWNDTKFYGFADFRNFNKLEYLYLSNNQIESINISGCTKLTELFAFNNNLREFNSLDSLNLKEIGLCGNNLESVSFNHRGNAIKLIGVKGTFSINYNSDDENALTIFVNDASEGIVFQGIYTADGTLIATEKQYSFNPTNNEYYVVFYDNSKNLLDVPKVIATSIPMTGNVKLTWNPVEGAECYWIYRANDKNGPYEKWCISVENEYVYETSTLGTTCYFLVRAASSNNTITSYSSEPVLATKVLRCPNIEIVQGDKTIHICWNRVSDADYYSLYRSSKKHGDFIKLIDTKNIEYIDSSAEPNTNYFYKVMAICESDSKLNSSFSNVECGYYSVEKIIADNKDDYKATFKNNDTDSCYSNVESTTIELVLPTEVLEPSFEDDLTSKDEVLVVSDLPEPTNIKVEPVIETGKPKVTWDKVDGASKYEVWRKIGANGTYQKYYTTTDLHMINTSTKPGIIYYYKVKAVSELNVDGDSIFSKEVRMACDLPQPTNIKIEPIVETGKPKVTWDKVDGASKYEVWRKVGANGTYQKYYTTTDLHMINTSTKPGIIYYYKVLAVCGTNIGGNSAFSKEVRMACDLPQPTNIKAKPATGTGKPEITWDKVDGASKYEVWRKVGSSGTYQKYYTTSDLCLTDTSARLGTIYFYKVLAVCGANIGGNSALSKEVSIMSN